MGKIERCWRRGPTRRGAIRGLAGFLAGSPVLSSQQDPLRDHSRVPGINELVTALDFEAVAYAKLPRTAYNYTAYGSAGEFTLRRNRQAFDWVDLVSRGVAGAGSIDTATEILGSKLRFPILVAPTAGHVALHPEGEVGMYQGSTAAAETPMIVSHVASMPIGEIAQAASGPLWYQLYPQQQIEANREPLDRAQAAGCQAIVVTVDQQAAYYERSLHDRNLSNRGGRRRTRRGLRRGEPNRYRVPTHRLWYQWKLFDDLRPFVSVPMLAKGILTACWTNSL